MDIIRQQEDEEIANLWHFKIGGHARDGRFRLADLSRHLEVGYMPADWLVDNEPEAQLLIDDGVYNDEYVLRRRATVLERQISDELVWLETVIPAINAMTLAQMRDVVVRLARQNERILQVCKYIATQTVR